MKSRFSVFITTAVPFVIVLVVYSTLVFGDRAKPSSDQPAFDESLDAVPDGAFDCLIEPMSLIELGGPTSGVVERILVKRGERVKKDQAVIELESSVENAFIEQAELRAAMESEIQAREAEFVLAKLEFARFDKMHARDLAPEQQRDEAAARLQVAAAAVVQADDNRRLLQLELQRLQHEVKRRTLRSPVNGIVVEHLVSVGEMVRDVPVTHIAELDPLRVEAVLPGRLFGTVALDYGATVYPEFSEGLPLHTTVDVVDPMLDAQSGTFGVELTLANADWTIVGGQRCRIVFDNAPPIAAALSVDDARDEAVSENASTSGPGFYPASKGIPE